MKKKAKPPSRGPWKIELESEQATIRAADGYDVCCIPIDPEYGWDGEDQANVRLIAAAPEMLRLLEWVYKNPTDAASVMGNIEFVLNAVKGE